MSDLTSTLVKDKMQREGLSLRSAASQIGVTHTTLKRVIDGEPFDVPTAKKISKWLGVNTSTLLDVTPDVDQADDVAQAMAAILATEPQLRNIFREAVKRVQTGEVELSTVREIVQYAAYRLDIEEEDIVANKAAEVESSAGDDR
ncbi:MAG: helix-turn-helix transcriptional regulator [Anaerolineales bacterium]|jgi:plasmid maintenance system antidote protein VapI